MKNFVLGIVATVIGGVLLYLTTQYLEGRSQTSRLIVYSQEVVLEKAIQMDILNRSNSSTEPISRQNEGDLSDFNLDFERIRRLETKKFSIENDLSDTAFDLEIELFGDSRLILISKFGNGLLEVSHPKTTYRLPPDGRLIGYVISPDFFGKSSFSVYANDGKLKEKSLVSVEDHSLDNYIIWSISKSSLFFLVPTILIGFGWFLTILGDLYSSFGRRNQEVEKEEESKLIAEEVVENEKQ